MDKIYCGSAAYTRGDTFDFCCGFCRYLRILSASSPCAINKQRAPIDPILCQNLRENSAVWTGPKHLGYPKLWLFSRYIYRPPRTRQGRAQPMRITAIITTSSVKLICIVKKTSQRKIWGGHFVGGANIQTPRKRCGWCAAPRNGAILCTIQCYILVLKIQCKDFT